MDFKAQIKQLAEEKKNERPFYKKKRFIIPAVLIGLAIIGNQFDDNKKKDENSSSSTQTSNSTSTNPVDSIDLKTKIQNNIKSISGGDELTKNKMNTLTDFQISVALFKAYAMTINEGKRSADKEVLKLTDELQNKVVASQVKNFPKIRKAYYEFLKNKLWENDVDVKVSGAGNTILKLTGIYFATNKNIKASQEALQEMLTLLRFKQTQYTWYDGQNEYIYYTIESPKDNEILE